MARRLEVYRRKRRFDVTPEPAPGGESGSMRGQAGGSLRFVVHKHHARSLHYDLRLEMGGALASWAVPRGPSTDPRDKRLAVETEDHPLEYGGFEGRIPEGEYGAGDSILWDQGTYRVEPPGDPLHQKEKGHLDLVMEGEKLRGRWHLVRTRPAGGKQQWLLFKGTDAEARPGHDILTERPESVVSGRRVTRGPESARVLRAQHPAPLDLLARVWPPMLATAASPQAADAAGDAGWSFEIKYDGFRALAALSAGRHTLQSRNGLDLSPRFPSVAAALDGIVVAEAVLDGEIAAVDRQGISRFQDLQGAAGTLRYLVFDLLWLDGEDLRPRPLEERRELAASLLAGAPEPIALAEPVDGPIEAALARARSAGWEGLLAKRIGSRYQAGRSRDWLKLKLVTSQELAIVGYTPISSGGPAVGALLLGVAEQGRLVYAGKVGTGYTDEVRHQLWAELVPDTVAAPQVAGAPRMRDARWVKPRLVAQVAFSEWTADGRLRHPSFLGLRSDKAPLECVRERPIAGEGGASGRIGRGHRT
jgi:bifunctional non-homologous end joining protein LigD